MRIVREGRWERSPARNEASRDVKFGEEVEEEEGGGGSEWIYVCAALPPVFVVWLDSGKVKKRETYSYPYKPWEKT